MLDISYGTSDALLLSMGNDSGQNKTHMYYSGDRVLTPLGPGRVVYVRMAPPDYRGIQCMSVYLDSKKGHATYSGTLFPIADVSPAPSGSLINDVSDMGLEPTTSVTS